MKDVITNARRRWPPAQFAVREVAVQGEQAARQVIAALTELDADPAVEVIVIARGGGGVEDLLPFSDQALLRAVAAANTPVVSAIGHEADSPLLDLVADLRASTPTDAGKRIVPDLPHELDALSQATTRLRAAINRRWLYEQDRLDLLHDRPALARPQIIIERYQVELDSWKLAGRRGLDQRINQANNQLASLNATLRALSPKATLARGYAVVTTTKGQVIRQASDVKAGSDVLIRLAKGQVRAQVH
jgi:exodeoxyribonuclease VII large subunit